MDEFESTRASTLQVLLSASDWNTTMVDAGIASKDSYFWYLYDEKSDHLQLIQLARDETDLLLATTIQFSTDEVRSALGTLMRDMKTSTGEKNWQALGAMAIFYWQGTTTRLVTPREVRHRFIIGYNTPSGTSLRPFAAPLGGDVNCPLASQQVKTLIEQVMQDDKQKHPEWFKKQPS
ncbi:MULTISPECIES: hypothetical protein [Acidithiobacillus]|uniref:hypothetical protein n=1 Tax=Acidithiobacillus TaxID=119977 RepID=UPI0004E23D76|nr:MULTISPECIES: hypothetical protein [Acidithiobacillus]MDD2750721.1 hypothetical protein [Acidithiobacillus sp.]MDD5278617.1 hypothetical protein [Acidithiobacillus sp.]